MYVKGLLKLFLLVVFFEGQYYHPDNLGAGTGLQFSTDDGNRKICFWGKTKNWKIEQKNWTFLFLKDIVW